jgi:hypothetical protein
MNSHQPIDFKALFESSSRFLVLLFPVLTILAIGDAYADAHLIKNEANVGKYLFEVFPNNSFDTIRSFSLNHHSFVRIFVTKQNNIYYARNKA